MRRHTLLLALLPGALTLPALAAPAAFTAQGGTATFEHVVRIVNVRGTVAGVTAEVSLDPADLSTAAGRVTVPVVNLKTGIGLRDEHARGEAALHTARYPNAVFMLDTLPGGRLVEGQTLATTATGRLTVKGVTKTLAAPVKATLADGRVNVSAQFKFNPHEFGVDYPGSSPSVSVQVAFTLTPRR